MLMFKIRMDGKLSYINVDYFNGHHFFSFIRTPLHCAASCNNLTMIKFLVKSGACIFATTFSDLETAAEKCEEEDEGFDGCSQYLYGNEDLLFFHIDSMFLFEDEIIALSAF